MIPIKIDDTNIAFRDLHFEKIKEQIENLLILKRDTFCIDSFEYKALDWIDWNLALILNSNTSKLRVIIYEFNIFVKSFSTSLIVDNSFTVKKLTKICKSNTIIGYSNKNKQYIISLINSFIPLLNKITPILKDIFECFYEKKWDDVKEYNRYTFVNKHNLKICPYCNMNYILISNEDKVRPDIDHFFPKSIYPYLAMSFYNLIPSCKLCNYKKSSKDTYIDGLLSPYEIDDNTFKLTYIPKNMNFLQIKKRKFNSNNFDIKFKKIDKNSNKYFKLDNLYAQHKDIVLELLIKKTIYTKSYIKELKKNFGFTDDEIYRFLLCNYNKDEDLHKRPLSKLIKDISIELELTNLRDYKGKK